MLNKILEESLLQALFANCIYKLDENMKMAKRIDSKLDISIMNQEKICRYLLPGEKVVKRPSGLPSFPVETQDELDHMEKFLHDDNNLSAAVSLDLSYTNIICTRVINIRPA